MAKLTIKRTCFFLFSVTFFLFFFQYFIFSEIFQIIRPPKQRLIKTSKIIVSTIFASCAERDESPRLRCKPTLPVGSPLGLQDCLPSSRITALHSSPEQGLGHHEAIVCAAALLLAFARRWRSLGCDGSSGARSEHFVLHQIAARRNPLPSLGEGARRTLWGHGDADPP